MTEQVTTQQIDELHEKAVDLVVTSVEFVATKVADFLLTQVDNFFAGVEETLEAKGLLAE